jgi:hypothetical protein
METVEAAAIRYRNVVYSVPKPGRHFNVCYVMAKDHALGPETMHDQGFVTSAGRFVDRYEARRLAEAAGQLVPNAYTLPQLFSEDVW